MILRIAQADAFGMAVEFTKDTNLTNEALKFSGYLKNPKYSLSPGSYTDDTQMSIAVMKTIMSKNITKEQFASDFVRTFKFDRRDGYARGFQEFLNKLVREVPDSELGQEFLKQIEPNSDKNGAAMRSVPIGVLRDPNEVVRVATLQAEITHNTPGGIDSSIVVALMAHFSMYSDEPFNNLKELLKSKCPRFMEYIDNTKDVWPFRVMYPDLGYKTAHAAYSIISNSIDSDPDVMRNTMMEIVKAGGDTDSLAAIVWGILSFRHKVPDSKWLEYGLEPKNEMTGVKFLKEFGQEFMNFVFSNEV